MRAVALRLGQLASMASLALAIGATSLRAEDPLNPEDLFNSASGYSLRLKAESARQEVLNADVLAAEWAFLPSIGISADWVLDGDIHYRPSIPAQKPDMVARHPSSTVGIQISFNLFDGMRRLNSLRAAQFMAQSGHKLTEDARQQLYLDVASAALAVVRDRKIVALRAKALGDRRRSQAGANALFDQQTITRTDVSESATRVDSAAAMLEGARGQLAASEELFTKLTGRPAPANLRVSLPRGLPQSAAEAAARAEAGNPKAAAAQLVATAARYQAEADVAAFLPNVDFVGQAGSQFNSNPATDRVDSVSAMLKIRIPLFDPSAFPKLTGARAEAKQRMYEAQDGRREVASTARTLFLQRASLSAQINVLASQIGHARDVAKGMAIERDAGTRTLIDQLDAEASIVEADIARIQAEYDRDRVGFMLLATSGSLSAGGFGGS